MSSSPDQTTVLPFPCAYCRDVDKLFRDFMRAAIARAGEAAIVPDHIRCPNCYQVVRRTTAQQLEVLARRRQ